MNVALYTRYSPGGRQTDQSTDGQLRDLYAFCEREGHIVVKEYNDRHITGRFDDRPEFQQMIQDSSKKLFQAIVVWKFDRFARNRYDSAIYKAKLKKFNIKVISITELITDSPEGIILEGVLESMAEYYSANLSKHVKRGLRENVIKGKYTGGIPPYGFKVVGEKLVADEEKAPIIHFVFEQYAAGKSKKEIIDDLKGRGIRNYYGRPLTFSCFQNSLRNEKYIGRYIYNGQEVTGGCEALIDETTFKKVQARLGAVKRAPAAGKATVEYLLQGKAFCGMCGARLVGESGRGRHGSVYNYYACANKKKSHTCEKKNEKKDFLEWYVAEQTVEYVLAPERMDYIATQVVKEYDKEYNDGQINKLERQITEIDKKISLSTDAYISTESIIIKKQIEEKIETLGAQRADLEQDLIGLKIANGIRYTKEQILAWMKTFCDGDPLDPEFQRRIIDVFVNAIYVYDDKVLIYYNIKDGKQITYIEMLDNTENTEEGTEGFEFEMDLSARKTHLLRQVRFSVKCAETAKLSHGT